jgi:squalene-hopene/tetraprenyl-beta-curcumene cyclase
MLIYRGSLDDRHLHAVIRAALRARGFTASTAELERSLAERQRLGCWLRDEALPERFAPFCPTGDYRALAGVDPRLWECLPRAAGFGFQQAAVLHGLAPVRADIDAAVALLGAAFNSAITLLDYLIDECRQGALALTALSPALVRGIFVADEHAQDALASACVRVSDPRLRLLFALVAVCAAEGRALHQYSGNHRAWAGLADLVGRLYEAERAVSLPDGAPEGAGEGLLSALEAKSALPFVALLQISTLASDRPQAPPRVQRASRSLGRLLWRVDDLVDLLADYRRGMPNALLAALAGRLAANGRAWAGDTDLYDVVDLAVGDVVDLLESCPFGGEGAPAEPDPADAALAAVQEFARLTVAGWVGWHEDEKPAAPPWPRPSAGTRKVEDRALGAAVERLLCCQRDGYAEAVHHLPMPRLAGPVERHAAVLFQRAVALDALLDADAAGLPVPQQVLNAEALAILRRKHRDVRGGWNYVGEVPELPPDADDLGQVLQVLYRLGGTALASTSDDGVRLALDAAGPDGRIDTWILDPRGHSAADEAVRAYLGRVIRWKGAHPEVMANLLYGLILYDPVRYHAPLQRAAAYLLGAQEEQGSWPCPWYGGPYYGTFRAVSVLQAVKPGDPGLGRARAFLRGSQRPGGAWGAAEGDPLSTAFALLALAAAGTAADGPAVEAGAAYLVGTQEADGGWPAVTWSSFLTGDGPVVYGSRTVTTAFCLKALLAASSGAAERGLSRQQDVLDVTRCSHAGDSGESGLPAQRCGQGH